MPSKGEYNPTVRSTVKVLRAGFRQSIERVVMVCYSPLPPVFGYNACGREFASVPAASSTNALNDAY